MASWLHPLTPAPRQNLVVANCGVDEPRVDIEVALRAEPEPRRRKRPGWVLREAVSYEDVPDADRPFPRGRGAPSSIPGEDVVPDEVVRGGGRRRASEHQAALR